MFWRLFPQKKPLQATRDTSLRILTESFLTTWKRRDSREHLFWCQRRLSCDRHRFIMMFALVFQRIGYLSLSTTMRILYIAYSPLHQSSPNYNSYALILAFEPPLSHGTQNFCGCNYMTTSPWHIPIMYPHPKKRKLWSTSPFLLLQFMLSLSSLPHEPQILA